MTVREVAERCKVTPVAVRNWLRGIRCGGKRIKLAFNTVGNRDRITEEALTAFHEECRKAKHGEPAPKVETPAQKTRRAELAADELYELLGRPRR